MERYKSLREWMRENCVTFWWTGQKLGMTDAGAARLLRADRVPQKRREELIRIGFPEALLPPGYIEKRKRKRLVPIWEQHREEEA